MYKLTEVIETPRTGTVDDLPLDDYIEMIRGVPFLARMEVARPVRLDGLPDGDHCLLIEVWFDDLAAARHMPDLPEFPELDATARRIHHRAGIRRYLSRIE